MRSALTFAALLSTAIAPAAQAKEPVQLDQGPRMRGSVDVDPLVAAFEAMAETEPCEVAGLVSGTVRKDRMALEATDFDGNVVGAIDADVTWYPGFGGVVAGDILDAEGELIAEASGDLNPQGPWKDVGAMVLTLTPDGGVPMEARVFGAWMETGPNEVTVLGGHTLCEE